MQSKSLHIMLRGVPYHVREWGHKGCGPTVFLLHGWGDVAASWQFVAGSMGADWHLLAPDWRGFGQSGRGADAFWFPDYLADLDALLHEYCPDGQVDLVGHSLGGNVACLYAGVKPARVRKLVAIDAFGLPPMEAESAPGRLQKWLAQLERGDGFRVYESVDAFAQRLKADNPSLSDFKADFLARHMTEPAPEGFRVAIDAAHRRVNPVLYRRAEAEACWRRVSASVLWVVQASPQWRRAMGVDDAMYQQACACFRDFRERTLSDCGHNMHHDQPEALAAILSEFLKG